MNASLYEIFFELQMNICERFPSLSPFDVRKKSAYEVFLLIRRLSNYNEKEPSTRKRVKRKPAGDNWF